MKAVSVIGVWFGLVGMGWAGCCPVVRGRAGSAAVAAGGSSASRSLSGTAKTLGGLDIPLKADYKVDFDLESDSEANWTSEWGQVEKISIETLGSNKVLKCQWNTAKGFDFTRAFSPAKDLSKSKRVSFQIFVPKAIAEVGYHLKVWLDGNWPKEAQIALDSADADKWKQVEVGVSDLSNVDFSKVNKLGIYLEPAAGGDGRSGVVTLYLDNIGLE